MKYKMIMNQKEEGGREGEQAREREGGSEDKGRVKQK